MDFPTTGDSSLDSISADDITLSLGFGFNHVNAMHQALDPVEPELPDEYQRPLPFNPYSPEEEDQNDPAAFSERFNTSDRDPPKPKKNHPPPRPPPPRRTVDTDDDTIVKKLRVNQVRWFYRDESSKRWIPFIGYDSCQLEWKYRKVFEQGDIGDGDDIERILVRGGLYEVDVLDKKCLSVYWSDEKVDVMRGTWFFHANPEPLEEGIAKQIETEHFAVFGGQKITEDATSKKGPKQVLKQMRFKDCHIDWNSIQDVFMYSNSTSSRIARSIGTSIGFSKSSTSGYRVVRGYHEEATLDDKPPPVSHLMFVVHGIGQIMDRSSIIKSCSDLRKVADKTISKFLPDLKDPACTKRIEFLPVEWRSALCLDNGIVSTITPQKLKGLRHILNNTGMDILYYSSPLYRSEIVKGLHLQLCRLYSLFCSRNPGFEANNGKVSIFAHSLGTVIVYDILTGWNPIHLYDQYLNNEQGNHPDLDSVSSHHEELATELNEARKKVAELEDRLLATNQVAVSIKTPKLDFQLDSFFCVGSPLAVFLVMRGFRAQGNGSISHIIPKSICKRIFNIYHPADPVAYRLEPLILKHYTTISPLQIHRADSPKKTQYEQMKAMAFHSSRYAPEEMTNQGASASSPGSTTAGAATNTKTGGQSASYSESLGSFLARFSRSEEKDVDIDALVDLQKELETYEEDVVTVQAGIPPDLESVELDQRVDFELRQSSLSSTYISAITSHSSYWSSADLSLFMLTQLFPEYLAAVTTPRV